MHRRLIGIALTLAALAVPAAAQPARDRALNPWAKPGVTLGFAQDMSLLRSERANSVVVVGVENTYVGPDNRAFLLLYVANRTSAAAIVSPASVTAADDKGQPLPILTVTQMTPQRFPLVDGQRLLAPAARQIFALNPEDFIATTPHGRAAPTGVPRGVAPGGDAIGRIAAAIRNPQTSASEVAAYAGLAPMTVPPGMMYATGATVQLTAKTKAFDMRIWVGGEDHWFTFQLQQ